MEIKNQIGFQARNYVQSYETFLGHGHMHVATVERDEGKRKCL